MTSLRFSYSRALAALTLIGFPLLASVSVILSFVSIYLLVFVTSDISMKFDAILVGALGIAFAYLSVVLGRTWYSVLTTYVVDADGIEVRCFGSSTSLKWRQLEAARYRRFIGQLELRFAGFPRLVVLTNVDMNWQRRTVLAALAFAQSHGAVQLTAL